MEWNNISENVKDDTNNVETEEVFINNVTIKTWKKEELLIKHSCQNCL